MDTNIGYRISMIIDQFNLNQLTFAESIKTTDTTVRFWIKGKRYPHYNQIVKILLTYPRINACWIFTGEGNMISNNDVVNYTSEESNDMAADKKLEYPKHNICLDCPFKTMLKEFEDKLKLLSRHVNNLEEKLSKNN